MSDTMNCPACQEPIMSGAKICKHCKSRIMKCPHCLEPTIEGEAKCVVCESEIAASGKQSASNEPSTTAGQKVDGVEDPQIAYMKGKKSFGVALFLNFLWAGWGVYYTKAPKGRWIVFVNIIAFILDAFTYLMPTLILLIWSTIICYQQVEIYNIELKAALENGTLEEFKKKYTYSRNK